MKFSTYKNGNLEANSRWFHHCSRAQIPFVTVAYRRRFADVEFDYITFNSEPYDNVLRDNTQQTADKTCELFHKYKNARSYVAAFGWGVVKLSNIEIEKAETAAEELYDYINELVGCINA